MSAKHDIIRIAILGPPGNGKTGSYLILNILINKYLFSLLTTILIHIGLLFKVCE